MIYLIGSLRNPTIPLIASRLREAGHEVFDDWYAAGPEADDKWREYEQGRGRDYIMALGGLAAQHVFHFDLHHLNLCDACILVCPGGRSAHLELGYVLGQRKPGYILIDNPDRWDVMYKFATGVFTTVEELIHALAHDHNDTNCHNDTNHRSEAQASTPAQAPNGTEGLCGAEDTTGCLRDGYEEAQKFHRSLYD